jgi:hypothetical protein
MAIANTPSLNASTRPVDQRTGVCGSEIGQTVAYRRVSRDHPTWVMPVHPRPPDHALTTQEGASMASTEYDPRSSEPEVSGWAVGGIVFAASMLTLIGVFQVIAGLVALLNDEFYVVSANYTFDLDVSAWGWIHMLVGLGLVATGFGLFARKTWAGVAGIMLAMLSALVNFFFVPYYPFWSILVIALNVWVIWSLTRASAIDT